VLSIQEHIKDRFNIKDDDFIKIKLLFFYSFSLGLFIAFYFVPANSQFLKNFGHKELPYAYIISGVVGIIAISFYSYIQSRRQSKTLFLSAIIIMAAIALLSRLFLFLIEKNYLELDQNGQRLMAKYLSFFVFIWAWPFIALVATITGGLAIRLFNLMQVKKFYGLINLGGVLAATISYVVISQIVKFLRVQYDLITIGSVGLITAFFILIYIYKKIPEKKIKKTENKKQIKQNFFSGLIKNKFLLFIFLGALFSAIIIYISDYGFLITIKENGELFNKPETVASFLSIVYAGLKIGELLISIMSGRILTKGGIKLGLITLSLVVTTLFLLAFLSAEFFGAGTFLFLGFVTANKMLERIIRRGIDDPAFNVLYQTLPDDQKLFIQTRVGAIQQGSIAIAGLLLLFVNFALQTSGSDFKVDNYPLYVLPILIFALFIAYKLYKKYKLRIREILAEKKMFQFEYEEKEIYAADVLQKFLLSKDIETSKFSTVVLSETNPRSLEAYAGFLLKINDNIIRKSVLSTIDSTYNEKLIDVIEEVGNKIGFKERDLRKLILETLFNLDYSEIDTITHENLKKLVFSTKKDKITATKYLFKKKFRNEESFVLHLLDSNDKTVKLAAIKIVSKRPTKKLWIKLISFLDDPEYNNILINILVEIGESVVDDLNTYFLKQNDPKIIAKIVHILAKIGSKSAQNILISYLYYHDKEIQNDVIKALYYSGFYAKEEHISIIRDKVMSVVENYVWFLVSIKDLIKEKNTLKLIQTLDLERINTLEQLFILLSFTQSPEIVDLIKTNIIGENTIFAIELIDNFIEPEIKKIIIPIFEQITIGQKIRRLKPYFFIKQLDFNNRLIDIVLTDESMIDVLSQAKALELIGKLVTQEDLRKSKKNWTTIQEPNHWNKKNIEHIKQTFQLKTIADSLWVSLLHPSEFIFTTSLKIIAEKGILNEKITEHLSDRKQYIYKRLVNGLDLIPDKVRDLRRVYLFYTVPEKSLTRLADIVSQQNYTAGNNISFFQNAEEKIIILVKGKLSLIEKNKKLSFNKNSILIRGLNVPQTTNSLTSETNCLVLKISRFKFFNLLASNHELVKNLFNTIKF
jgi:ATP:ADP antiporter, AAA family